jgi:hypothetical protein
MVEERKPALSMNPERWLAKRARTHPGPLPGRGRSCFRVSSASEVLVRGGDAQMVRGILILTFSPGEKEQLRRVGILRRRRSRIRYG